MATFPKVPLILSPTPLHPLPRLSAELGMDLWIKRDDLTGFAMGGNKGRKLEYLLADAREKLAEVIVTCGSRQSNFIRQLGAAGAVLGIRVAAAVMDVPYEFAPPTERGPHEGGNLVLDEILGVDMRAMADGTWETLYAAAEELAVEYEAKGNQVYRIPIGGSSPLGALGFRDAGIEVMAQAATPFDVIAFASSSGSTHTGLMHAFSGTSTRILGFACDPEPEIAEDFAALSAELDALLGTSVGLVAADFELDFNFVGPGYGVPSAAGDAALRTMAQREGIFLDPIYSGKAFAGLRARAAEFRGQRVLFWHTGGAPSLFMY